MRYKKRVKLNAGDGEDECLPRGRDRLTNNATADSERRRVSATRIRPLGSKVLSVMTP
jgi:hypothetical protein